jgi:hypothetical protein
MKNTVILLFVFLVSFSALAACDGHVENFPMIDPTDQKPFNVTAKVFRPELGKSEKMPVIFILPPIVGETIIDRKLAAKFCGLGMGAYIVNTVKDIPLEEEIPDLSVHDKSYVRALAGVRTVIASLETDPSINQNFGILGMSLGGMLATFVAGSETKIKASVIVVGAGNVPGVLAYSEQERVKAQREGRQKLFNIPNQKTYEEILKPLVPNDPINVAPNIRPGSMYMFIAVKDVTVPTRFQQELRNKVPDPLVYEMNANHFNGIVKAGTIHAGKIANFFLSQL